MRTATLLAIPAALVSIAAAFELPDFQPFFAALPVSLSDYIPPTLSNQTAQHELLKRAATSAGSCPTDFINCSNLGASQLCCETGAVCSADFAGHVACCPSGAACSGTITGVVTSGTLNSNGAIVGGATDTTSGLVTASTTTTSGQTTTTTSGGLVAASTQSSAATTGNTASGSDFVLASGTTVATPAAGIRAAQIPLLAKVIIRVLEHFPL